MKKLFSTRYSAASFSLAMLLLRVAVGGLMLPHGYSKLMNFAAKSSTFADPFHLGPAASMALTVFAEFFCAGLIVLGLLTRLACIPLIIAMSVVVFYSHHADFTGKAELPALYLAGFLVLLLLGPGRVSIDRLIGK